MAGLTKNIKEVDSVPVCIKLTKGVYIGLLEAKTKNKPGKFKWHRLEGSPDEIEAKCAVVKGINRHVPRNKLGFREGQQYSEFLSGRTPVVPTRIARKVLAGIPPESYQWGLKKGGKARGVIPARYFGGVIA